MKKFYSLGDLKTQICTTREQSERLIELGLKRETADMCWTGEVLQKKGDIVFAFTPDEWEDDIQPRWSLHRLISLCDDTISINHNSCVITYNIERDFYGLPTIYDNMVDCIMWLVSEGRINKEYLNK